MSGNEPTEVLELLGDGKRLSWTPISQARRREQREQNKRARPGPITNNKVHKPTAADQNQTRRRTKQARSVLAESGLKGDTFIASKLVIFSLRYNIQLKLRPMDSAGIQPATEGTPPLNTSDGHFGARQGVPSSAITMSILLGMAILLKKVRGKPDKFGNMSFELAGLPAGEEPRENH